MCGIEDRLILDAFDTQHDFKTKARTIRGLSQTDIGMHNSLRADFFLAQLGRGTLDCRQEARRVTGSEELIRVMSAFASPANRFGSREFEVERGCLVGGHRRYGAVEPTGASSGHCIEVIL